METSNAEKYLKKRKIKDMGYLFSHNEDETPKERLELKDILTDFHQSEIDKLTDEKINKLYGVHTYPTPKPNQYRVEGAKWARQFYKSNK